MTGIIRYFYGLIFSPSKALLWRLPSVLGFLPRNGSLYMLAFIHKSTALVDKNNNPINNERLEYLGDAVLGSVIGEYLYKKYPDQNEGFLTKMRSKMVSGEALGDLAIKMKLDELINSHVSGEQSIKHISGDSVESLIGAIYLDRGYGTTRRFIHNKIVKKHLDLNLLETRDTNHKSQLIEWAQKGHKEVIFYTDMEPYDPTRFISYVSINDKLLGSGSGASKKEAEQEAALETMKEINNR